MRITSFFFARRHPLLAALCVLALVLPFDARAGDSLLICYENANVRPWRHTDGSGLNFRLLDEAARQLKLDLRYVARPWKRCLLDLKENRVQGALGASYKPERLEFGAYPSLPGASEANPAERMYQERYVVLKRKETALTWDGKRFALRDKPLDRPLGAQLGYSVVDNLKALGVAVDDGAHSAEELLRKVSFERVVGAVLLAGEAQRLLDQTEGARDTLEILPQPMAEKNYYLMLSHTFIGQRPELARRLWSGIARVRDGAAYRNEERRALGQP